MPTPTVRVLLARRELSLTLLTRADAASAASAHPLDAPISWVHSSDLLDPTPFVIPGQVLLTTGTQFGSPDRGSATEQPSDDDSDYDGYVARLAAAGVVGLGFGVEVVRQTPPGLLGACERAGLPLFEVPYRTPFIAVARYVADLVAEQAYARSTWALSALRAVSLAALRPDGLAATLAELARLLDRWVALVNAHGAVELVSPVRALTPSARAGIESEAKRMLAAKRRAASTVSDAGTVVSLQTIGSSDRLLGVLAHGGASDLDQAAQQVVTSAVAIAGLALDRERALESTRTTMRETLLRSLESSSALLAELGAEAGMPAADSAAIERSRVRAEVAVRSAAASAAAAAPPARGTLDASGSTPRPATETSGTGRKRDTPGDSGRGDGRESLLAMDAEDARARASALLAPLLARDPDGALADSLLVWLDHNGVYDAAARALGVHRHTVTARIRTAEQALGRDLAPFATRAEVWAALRVLTRTGAA
jgi:purine catabolism regulator